MTQGVPTAGRVPNGAIVERSVKAEFDDQSTLTLQLRNPEFSTAIRIADAINDYTSQRFGMRVAGERNSRTVQIRRPKSVSAARFYAEIENLVVESDTPARVVIDERTGTIVIGNDVKISRVAISHGTLTVRITEAPRVVQPEPFSKGETAVEPFTAIDADGGEGLDRGLALGEGFGLHDPRRFGDAHRQRAVADGDARDLTSLPMTMVPVRSSMTTRAGVSDSTIRFSISA